MINEKEYNDLLEWTNNAINTYGLWRAQKDEARPGKEPGKVYTWMFEMRSALCNPEFASNIAKLFLYRIKEFHPDFKIQIAAIDGRQSGLSAALAVAAFSEGISLNVLSIREQRRPFGAMNWIHGISNGLPTVLVEDAANAHSGFRQCYSILKQQKIPISDYSFCILNKVNKDDPLKLAVDAFLPQTMHTLWLFCLDDFGLRLGA